MVIHTVGQRFESARAYQRHAPRCKTGGVCFFHAGVSIILFRKFRHLYANHPGDPS